MNIVPWLAFGLAFAGAVVSWVIAANKTGRAAVLENGMRLVQQHAQKLENLQTENHDTELALTELRLELRALREGLKRVERAIRVHVKEAS